jgi:hypothetical protein
MVGPQPSSATFPIPPFNLQSMKTSRNSLSEILVMEILANFRLFMIVLRELLQVGYQAVLRHLWMSSRHISKLRTENLDQIRSYPLYLEKI